MIVEGRGPGHGLRARRPPRQRHQARQRARRVRSVPPARPTSCPDPAGFLGPSPDVRRRLRRRASAPARWIVGANRPDLPLGGVMVDGGARPTSGRSRPATRSTATRSASSRRSRSATSSSSARATASRSAATYLDENGKEQLIVMGSYGIGPGPRSPPRRSSSTPTSAASRGRGRSRRGTSSSSRMGKPGTPERDARRGALRASCAAPASTSCSTTATPGRARSSPMPSSSAARCA